jgi:diaminohydroxyphosphoribosylaminopyrimidine deaminase/5-amino-6-(5-phosphoribosylamino)uracil reductase
MALSGPDFHQTAMRRALDLAERGRGSTSPNPVVGAVLAKGGRILAEGFHTGFGGPHAEVEALRRAGSRAKGASLYVTLEPCSTFGKTPPCTRRIAESGIREVRVACRDPNPAHGGRGITALRKTGVRVSVGLLAAAAEKQNEIFSKWIATRLPFVSLKMAETLDGKIAGENGVSRWITGRPARACVHRLRARHAAVLVGKNTVLMDHPRLHVRIAGARQPLRVVIDPRLEIPLAYEVFKPRDGKILVAACESHCRRKFLQYRKKGVGLLGVRERKRGELDLRDLLQMLGRMEIDSVLVEGGGETAARFLDEKLVDKIYFFIAPKILGGRDAKTAVEGCARPLRRAVAIRDREVKFMGEDLLVTGYPVYS